MAIEKPKKEKGEKIMSKKNYTAPAEKIVSAVGGESNIINLYHCVTRLRFKLKDVAKADKATLEGMPEVLSVVQANGQYQVVIGNDVENMFDAVMKNHSIENALDSDSEADSDQGEKGNPVIRFFNVISSIFNPIIIALAGAGMLKALLVLCTSYLGMSQESSTYSILAAAGNSVFYFLPIFLAFSAARVFKANPYISVAIVGALLEPNFTGLVTETGAVVDFIGIPTYLMTYTSTVIPAIISVYMYSLLEKQLKKFIPKNIEIFALSLAALLIMVPLTVIVIGPIGVFLGDGIGSLINFASARSGLLAGAILGAGWTFLVMTGVHWGIVPIMLNNIALYGEDPIRPMVAAATFASAGVALGVFMRSKNKDTKALAISSMMPALLGGITEPIVYGLSVKFKRPLIAQTIAGGIAGAFIGAMGTTASVYVFPAITTFPAFAGPTFIYYLIGITGAFIGSAILTYILGFKEDTDREPVTKKTNGQTDDHSISAPVSGKVIPISEVNDPVFSQKAMGDGVGIIPDNGTVKAPADGVIETVFPTGHAVGIKTTGGYECLIHIGIDTVSLNGEGFETKVKQGDKVKKGQVLVEFDLDLIKQKGYDPTVMVCITNMDLVKEINIMAPITATDQDVVIDLVGKGV